METPLLDAPEKSILVLAPIGRDAEIAASVLSGAGMHAEVCATLGEVIPKLSRGCGAVLMAEEALVSGGMPALSDYLAQQPAWSDLPIVLLTNSGRATAASQRAIELFGPAGNVSLLDRPIQVMTLVTTLHAALRARRRQYEVRDLLQQRTQVLASIRDAFITVDRAWRYTYVNEQACELCQLPLEQLLGRTLWEVFPNVAGTNFEKQVRATMEDGSPRNFEWLNERWERWFSVRAYPSESGLALFTVEITERKQTELELERARHEAVEANRAKDHFLAALSHELRTPLTPVLMTAAALQQDPNLSEDVRSDLAMIERNVELEARLIDDLLDLTRITRGKLSLCRETLDLHELIARAVKTCCDPEITQKHLQVTFKPEATEHYTAGDPARLQQVLWNLLNNAVKFTPPGGEVIVTTGNPAPGQIQLTIADTGIGIDPEYLPRLFDAFEQGNATITRRFGGLGLGLAISKAITDLHGGSLVAQSEGRGHGAVFTLKLASVRAPRTRSAALQSSPTSSARSLHILLVEDHDATRGILRRLLEKAGHRVEAASTVGDALRLAAQDRFELLVSDLGLPDASGAELMAEMRSRYGIVGIALSGYGMEEDVKASTDAGFALHLTKPVDWKRLEAAITTLADRCEAGVP